MKENDAMTIYTFAKPDTITISAETYQKLLRKSFNYDALIRVMIQGIEPTTTDDFRLTYNCESNVRTALRMFEPELINRKLETFKDKEVE